MSDIRIKMAKDLRDMSDMVGDLHWMAAKAVEDLTKKDGEIAKRDEELAACRATVENCDLFRARIAELEAMMQWRLIETAPKGGILFDVFYDGYDRICDCYFNLNGVLWCKYDGDPYQVDEQHLVTHWIPAPSPPAAAKEGE